MNPPARGLGSLGRKQGRVLPFTMTGTLLPSNSCWPKRAEIYEWLTLDPLAPDLVIMIKLLRGNCFYKPYKDFSIIFELNLLTVPL